MASKPARRRGGSTAEPAATPPAEPAAEAVPPVPAGDAAPEPAHAVARRTKAPPTPEAAAEAAPAHPEEIRGELRLTIGERAVLQMHGRITPAGLVTAGVMVASILLSTASLVWSARRRP
ncbi:hypothetical protein [Roseicella frigidaeris]|uniref:Uncharacterized protein n=1 Tax=Roseicella frigidaeris TaxID=2230885 RepID=A0A327M6V3_9PROT|nr:hypothetical protein [Roseicella frigidaeris]RAI58489.1 hypothetical protein DOO78_14185 [Roseicella frigidaeris]